MNKKQKTYFILGIFLIAGILIASAIIYSPAPIPEPMSEPDGVPVDTQEKNVRDDSVLDERKTRVSIDIENWPSKGDPNAPILMVEYSDFTCPFCAIFSQETLPKIEEAYIRTGKVYFVYKNFIVSGGGKAAEAAHCAAEQGKFWEYYSLLYSRLDEDRMKWGDIDIHREYAKEIGLNADDLVSCLEERRHQARVQSSTQEGIRNGVEGTPAFFINGRMIGGAQPFHVFQEIIEQELANL